jgi:hypothetical protein
MRKNKLGVNNANMPNVQSEFVMFMSCGLVVNGRPKLLKYHITLVLSFFLKYFRKFNSTKKNIFEILLKRYMAW